MRFPKVSTTNINGLPLGYTEVEYLEGTGTQYIDTGYIPNNNSEIEIVCNSGGVQGTNLFGYRNASANSKNITITTSNTGTTVFYTNDFNNSNYNTYRYNFESNANQILKLKLSKSERSVYNTSGTLLGGNSVSCPDVFTCDSTAYLMNVAGTPFFTQCFKGKVYSCKISEAGVLVRDFIPCLDSNNRPCMYDKVEGKPYYNVGPDEFSYGRKIYGVEYLKSTADEYIDTGIKFDGANTKIELMTYEDSLTRTHSICGDDGNFFYYFRGTGNWAVGYKGTAFNIVSYMSVSDVIFVIDKNNVYVNGVLAKTYTASSTVSSYNTLLFNRKTTRVDKGAVTMYYCKIWDNDVLVRDYVPVRDENNVGYMLDKVSHTLYENKGTGAFVVGKDTLGKSKAKLIRTKTTVSGLPYGYTEVEYLEGNGNQYIDTGIHPTDTYGYRVRNTYTAGAGEQCAIGCMDSGNRFVGVYTSGSANGISGAWGDYVGFLPSYTWSTGTILDVKGNYKNNRKLIIDSTEMKDISDIHISGTIENTVYLFARHYGSTITKMRGRIYSAEITNGQDVMNKFIPALDSSNRPCMYDIIEGKAYYNQGTGEFTYGPKIIPVEYLESTGTQYIDTGVMGKNNIDFDYRCIFTNINGTGQCVGGNWSGAGTSSVSLYFGLIRANGNFAYHYDGTSSPVVVMNTTVQDTPYSIQGHMWVGEQYMVINGTKSSVGTISSTFTSSLNMYLFGINNNGLSNPVYMKLYYCKIWDNETLVRDYIPVKDENNVGYMFDRVSHTLYTNAGTGNFVVGDEKIFSKVRFIEDTSEISKYTKLKCLISSGTQYIDTGFKPNNNTEYEVSGYMNPSGVFGVARWSDESTYDTFGAHSVTANPLDYYGRYSDNKYYNCPSSVFNNNIIWKHTKNNISITNADNDTVYVNENITTATFQSTYNMWVFAFNNMGSILARSVGCKIYYFKIWDNNALIRDYIPVLRNSDNKPGMYDRVTKTFFTNQGTGEFTYETL